MILALMKKIYRRLTLTLEAVEIETTTVCNRKCPYCPNYTIGRPAIKMDDNIFYTIIDSLRRGNFKGRISPHFFGEPLTDDRLEVFIKHIRSNLPTAHIKLFTNGDLLTIDRYLELKNAGVDIFRISQHSQEPSEAMAGTLAYVKRSGVGLGAIEYINYHDMYYRGNNSDSYLENRGGLVNVKPSKKTRCAYVRQMTIDYKGNVILCCNDYNSSIVFGNVMKRDLFEIWHDKNYVKIRKTISKGNWMFDICKRCVGVIEKSCANER